MAMEEMPQGQAPQEGAPQEGGGDIAGFVQNLGQGIATLGEMVQATPDAPQEAGPLVDQLMQSFEQLVQVMAGGGGQQAPADNGRPNPVPVNQPEGTPV